MHLNAQFSLSLPEFQTEHHGLELLSSLQDQLNKEQTQVLQSIYSQCLTQTPAVSLVEGPPGTGKSRLIVNLILQLVFGKDVSRRLRILVCAHSNAAVDILALKLMKIHAKINPLGEPTQFSIFFAATNRIDIIFISF